MTPEEYESTAIVIDTDQYAGNFEREMCAFVTGQAEVGGRASDLAEEVSGSIRHLSWWNEHISQEEDDRETMRPVSICTTPGWFNNGMGGHYRDDPAVYAEAAKAGAEAMRKHLGDNLERSRKSQASGMGSWQGVDLEKVAAENDAKVERMEREARRSPAYMSVAIFVDEVPPEDVMDELRERAMLFASERRHLWRQGEGDPLAIEGIRVIEPVPSPRP